MGFTHTIFNMPDVYEITPLETFAREVILAVAVVPGAGLAGERITWIGVLAMFVILSGVGAIALVRGKSKTGQH
jgi:hypothetical protein